MRRRRCTRDGVERRRHPPRDRSQVPVRVPDQHADAVIRRTDRRARKPSAEAFARLFESVHEGVYIGTVDGEASQTLAANPHLKLMFGFGVEADRADVRPFELERFVDPQARDGFLGRLQRDGAVTDYLLRLRRADKTPMWVEVTAHAERSRDGLRIEALMRDVSERKRLEDQARDLYHQLLQAEKLAALGQTISGVAHELNNPLATILTWAERLSQRPADEQTRRGLETILSESERAAKIVRNLLTFARKRHTTRAMVDLNQVVRETLALRSYEQRVNNITIIEALAAGPAAGVCRSAPDPAGPAQPDHQRRAGDDRRQRPRHARRPHLARPRSRRRRARSHRRWAGRAGRRAAEDLRSVLHDQGRRQGHRARPDRRLRDRAGARRPDHDHVGRRRAARRSPSSCRSAPAR